GAVTMTFLTSLWSGLQSLLGLVLPIFGKARAFRGIGTGLRWIIHIILVVAIVVGLHFLNQYLELDKKIPSPSELLRKNWLPILFLLIYVLAWLGWWLYKLLGSDDEGSEFPDIDAAWQEATGALTQAGIGLVDAPLFLVLGKPAGTEEALLLAAQLQLTVKQAPARPDAPLHVYANRDAIYVTCAGASLLGRHAELLSGPADAAPMGAGAPVAAEGASEADIYATMRPAGRLRDVQALLSKAREENRSLTDEEQREVRRLMGEDEAEHAMALRKSRPPLLRDTAQPDYLCAGLQ